VRAGGEQCPQPATTEVAAARTGHRGKKRGQLPIKRDPATAIGWLAPSRYLAAAAGGGSRRPALPATTATQGTEAEGAGAPRPNATRPPLSPDTALQEPGGGRRCGGRRHEQWAGRGKGGCGRGHGSRSAAVARKRTRRKARALPSAHEHHPREVAGGTSPAAASNTTRTEWGPSKKSARTAQSARAPPARGCRGNLAGSGL